MELNALNRRAQFSDMYKKLIADNPEIEHRIHDCVPDTDPNAITFFYGGRMWNRIVHKYVPENEISAFSDVKRSAILSGNYDMVSVIPNATAEDPNYYNTVYEKVKKNVKEIHKLFKAALGKTHNVILDYDKSDAFRTITIGRGFRIYTEPSAVRYTRATKTDDDDHDSNSRMELLFYLELGRNMIGTEKQCICPFNAKNIMIEPGTKYLSAIGLIMLSQFLTNSRDTEKGVPIDAARSEIMRDYLLPIVGAQLSSTTGVKEGGAKQTRVKSKSAKHNTRRKYKLTQKMRVKTISAKKLFTPMKTNTSMKSVSPSLTPSISMATPTEQINTGSMYVKDPVNVLLYITLVLFPMTFNIGEFVLYRYVSGAIIENIFKLYYPEVKSAMDTLDTYLLDAPGGGTVGKENDPSMRQVFMLWITHLASAFNDGSDTHNKYSLQLSGGDVFRAYLTDITQTADIDTKLFIKPKAYMNMMQFAFFISTLIAMYLHANSYFRIENHSLYDIHIGGHVFTRTLHTVNQEIIATSRVLPRFVVPLVSIDLKLNGTIDCPDIVFEKTIFTEKFKMLAHENKIPIFHSVAPLDISLIRTNKIVQQPICHPIQFYRERVNKLPKTINLAHTTDAYCHPPYPPFDYLVSDLEKIVNENKRPQKLEKDKKRLSLIKKQSGELDMSRVFEIQQVGVTPNNYEILNATIHSFIHKLISTQVYLSKENLDVYTRALNEYWEHLSIHHDPNFTPDMVMKIIKRAGLYSTKIPIRYKMPHGYAEIHENKTGDDMDETEL